MMSGSLKENEFSGRFAVGQNIARTWTTRPPGPYDSEPNWRRQIASWFNEVQHYRAGFSPSTGHYTQVHLILLLKLIFFFIHCQRPRRFNEYEINCKI